MDVLSWMQPRDHDGAARSVTVLCSVAAAVTILFAPLQPKENQAEPSDLLIGGGVVAVVLLIAVLARRFQEANRWAWAASPVLAVGAIVVLDLLTNDSSVAAQIFFIFPILYGASQLPVPGAVVVTAVSFAGEIVVVSQLPLDEAVLNAGYVIPAFGTTAALLAISRERQARLVARLEQMAAVDPLTGLVTRRVFDEAAASALTGARNDEGTSLILLDIDNFKTINDERGHPVGDAVLVQLARLIVERTRDADVVCRLGGDEIAVLMPACSLDVARRRAEDLLAHVRRTPFVVEDEPLPVRISVGLAHAPSDADGLTDLYAAADGALYRAKRSGRDRLAVAADHAGSDGETGRPVSGR